MSTLDYEGFVSWRNDGITRALVAGGVPLERHFAVGFTGGPCVRRAPNAIEQEASDYVIEHEPDDDE